MVISHSFFVCLPEGKQLRSEDFRMGSLGCAADLGRKDLWDLGKQFGRQGRVDDLGHDNLSSG